MSAKQHPEVADATAKSLYANAICCASPDCDEPLYRTDSGGKRTLNSRIAHICARSENGPRWDQQMTADANRSADNLVLLCLFHADLVDQQDRIAEFPKELLLEWKAQQLKEYDDAVASGKGAGWQLTDAEADEVVAKSERSTVTVIADTIYAGGMGGQLGGGGGGGAVIGTGSLVGGQGGDAARVILEGQAGQAPGAGGGGAGGLFYEGPWIPHVGDGTAGRAHIAGFDGNAGGDTIFESGDFKLVAPGGKGAQAGLGVRKVSDQLRVSALMPANYAAVDHGLVHVINGAWSHFDVVLVPAQMSLAIVCVIEAGGVEVGEYTVAVEIHGPSGESRARSSLALSVDEQGDLIRVACNFFLSFDVHELGIWRISASSDAKQLAAVDLMFKQPDLEST